MPLRYIEIREQEAMLESGTKLGTSLHTVVLE